MGGQSVVSEGREKGGGWGVEGTGKKLGKLRERKKGMGKESERGEVRGEQCFSKVHTLKEKFDEPPFEK